MDGFQIIMLVAAAAGVILVVFSFFIQSKKDGPEDDFTGAENVIKAVDESVAEADGAADELNKLAGSVMRELDNKYQELLFLYNLIDEKKKETYADYKDAGQKSGAGPKRDTTRKRAVVHPKHQEIVSLVSQGVALPDVAKKLGMGQGEVSLILELGSR